MAVLKFTKLIIIKMFTRSLIRRLPTEERNLIRDGGIYAGIVSGIVAYS
jgi:hypothetical protein